MRYAIISVAVKRGIDDALDKLLEAANLGSGPRGLAAHQDQQVNSIESQLEFFLVADQTENRLGEEEREVCRAIVEPGLHELKALEALLDDGAALEFALQDEDHVDWELCRGEVLVDRRAQLQELLDGTDTFLADRSLDVPNQQDRLQDLETLGYARVNDSSGLISDCLGHGRVILRRLA